MDARLSEVAHAGDTNGLYNCIRDDADVLTRIDIAGFVDTPLHIAAARGHADFAMAIVYLKPSLAQKLNQDFVSPMHLALQNGHKEMVLRFLAVDKDLVRVKGKEGYTPFHHAVRQGNLDLLSQFLEDCPACIEDATIRNETALHIAAQNNRLDALEILARSIRTTYIYSKISRHHLLNLKDRDGNTPLHIAAANTQPQMIKLLLEYYVDTEKTNMSGLTASNVLKDQIKSDKRDESLKILHDFDQRRLRGLSCMCRLITWLIPGAGGISFQECLRLLMTETKYSMLSMSTERINALLVVLTLMLTTTYQAMINPPGGVWTGDLSGNVTAAYMAKVGTSIMDVSSFTMFFELNSTVFILASLLTVAFLPIATKSWSISIFVMVLMSLLVSSVYVAHNVIAPYDLPYSRRIFPFHFPSWKLICKILYNSDCLYIVFLHIIPIVILMEGGRRFLNHEL